MIEVTVEVDRPASVNVDGRRVAVVEPGESASIRRGEEIVRFLTLKGHPFPTAVRHQFGLDQGFDAYYDAFKTAKQTDGKQARAEAETARVSIRNIRRDVLGDLKDLLKEKEITEDEDRRAQEQVQKITDNFIQKIDDIYKEKEKEILEF